MNCTIRSILHIKKAFLIANSLQNLCWVAKNQPKNLLKLNRTNVIGFLISGCCFSRKNLEEPLLPNVRDKSNISEQTFNKLEHSLSVNLNSEDNANSVNMKRKIKSVDKTVANESICDENTEEIQSNYKKLKLVSGENITTKENEPNTSENCISEISQSDKSLCLQAEKRKKQRPNYFVAIKISNDEIRKALKNVQDHILIQEGKLEKSMIELKTLHITLMVMCIYDSETHERALKALESVHSEHDENLSQNPLKLEFKGLGHFQNRVLYAKLSSDDAYKRLSLLASSVKEHFASAEIYSTDTKEKGFTPHLTVAKIDHKKRQQRFVKKINPSLYKEYNDSYFGIQNVESIQLLSMTNPKTENGYYSGDEIYFSAFNPSNRISCLNKLLAIEEKKKSVKEKINMLAKEKLK